LTVYVELDRSCDAREVERRLPLTAEERARSRFVCEDAGIALRLPRGTVLREDDVLRSADGQAARVVAKPEPVLRVTSDHPSDLVRAAYHLGNRHAPVELHLDHLILGRDPVLAEMLEHLGLRVEERELPFFPERGAYEHHAETTHRH
jgi:urease accessory protein